MLLLMTRCNTKLNELAVKDHKGQYDGDQYFIKLPPTIAPYLYDFRALLNKYNNISFDLFHGFVIRCICENLMTAVVIVSKRIIYHAIIEIIQSTEF